MILHTLFRNKTLVVGLGMLGSATLLCCAPSCKAQEMDPDHFTTTGVETFPERSTPTPPVQTKNKTRSASSGVHPNLAKRPSREQKAYHPPRKTSTTPTS